MRCKGMWVEPLSIVEIDMGRGVVATTIEGASREFFFDHIMMTGFS